LSIKEQIGPDIIIMGDLTTPLSSIGKILKQKLKKIYPRSKNIMDEMDLVDFYTVFSTTAACYAFFLVYYGTFSNIDHILYHKA
jgi:hypothetical protein